MTSDYHIPVHLHFCYLLVKRLAALLYVIGNISSISVGLEIAKLSKVYKHCRSV